MQATYEGTLKDNHIDWDSDAPPSGRALHVYVTISNKEEGNEQRGQRMAQALNNLAENEVFREIDDPAQWQRDIRAERPLPSRRK
jgi:hypothetical protein